MLIDVLTLITPDPKVLGNNYLVGSTPSVTYVGLPDANGLQDLVYMKGLSGYPWDWLTVGDDFIYQRLTELTWGDPTTGKLMFGKGSPRFPRWIDYSYQVITSAAVVAPPQVPGLTASLIGTTAVPSSPPVPGQWQFLVSRPQTDYVIYTAGAIPNARSSDGNVRNTFRGPYPGAAVDDLPAGEDWISEYEWGGKLTNGVLQYGTLERIYHRRGYGRYRWESYTALNGVYPTTPNQSSQTTFIKPLAQLTIPIQKIF